MGLVSTRVEDTGGSIFAERERGQRLEEKKTFCFSTQSEGITVNGEERR